MNVIVYVCTQTNLRVNVFACKCQYIPCPPEGTTESLIKFYRVPKNIQILSCGIPALRNISIVLNKTKGKFAKPEDAQMCGCEFTPAHTKYNENILGRF